MALGGVDWVAVQQAMQNWVVSGSGLSADKVVWSQQPAPRPAAPAIVLRIANISEHGQAWLDTEKNPFTFNDLTVESVDDATDEFVITGHDLLSGDGPVRITTTGTLPTNLSAGTDYWIIKSSDDRIKFATSYLKSKAMIPTPVDLVGTGSGTITVVDTSDTLRAGEELKAISRSYLRTTLELVCHSAVGVGMEMATSLLQRVRTRRLWPSQVTILQNANIGLMDVDRVRAIQGEKDDVIFEPRAYLDVHMYIPCEESEALTIIENVELTNLLTGQVFTVPE